MMNILGSSIIFRSRNVVDESIQIQPYRQPLTLVMHAGPPKTATSTIQCALRNLEHTVLTENHIAVMETESCRPNPKPFKQMGLNITRGGGATYDNVVAGAAFMPNCLTSWLKNTSATPKCWTQSYGKYLEEQKHRGNSVVMSQEILVNNMQDPDETKKLYKSIAAASPGFQVVVIAGYRHWFDWIVSWYGETYKAKSKPALHRWVKDGGRKIPSVEEFVDQALRKGAPGPFTDSVVAGLKNHLDVELVIIDFHSGKSVEESFFFDGMPTSVSNNFLNTCNHVKNNYTSVKENQATDHVWYDMLANEAHLRGLVPGGISRREMASKISDHQSKSLGLNNRDFPQVCPSQDFYDRVLNESLRLEEIVKLNASHFTIDDLQRQLRSAFADALSRGKFCTINTTAVLEDPKWVDFFRGSDSE